MASPGGGLKVPVAARFLPRSVFYGWYVAVACGLMMWVTVGVGYYGLSTFLRPLQDEHDWSAGVVSGAPACSSWCRACRRSSSGR